MGVFEFALGVVAIVFGMPLLILLLWTLHYTRRGRSQAGGDASSDDDARIIQEIHRGLSRMEARIEALETLLSERDKEGDKK